MSATLSPDRLLKQMADLWVTLAKEGPAEAGVLRACSMTLVVVTPPGDDEAALGETLAALMPEHPARTILIHLREHDDKGLSADVTAQCWMPFGQRRQICSEHVVINAPDDALEDVASVVSPIVAADLPVVMWCRTPGLLNNLNFRYLARTVCRVVVDTQSWPDARSALQTLATAFGRGVMLGDLSWTRLTEWREMLSRIFENRQNSARLHEITRARVVFGGPKAPVSAYYLAAWVVDALASAGVQAEPVLAPDVNGASGRVVSLELSGGDFRVKLESTDGSLVTTVGNLSNCTNSPEATDYSLMREELRIVRTDPVYEATLRSAVRL
jgi:glucose-6-phosphate dehydrogenase assembly protein OpcA